MTSNPKKGTSHDGPLTPKPDLAQFHLQKGIGLTDPLHTLALTLLALGNPAAGLGPQSFRQAQISAPATLRRRGLSSISVPASLLMSQLFFWKWWASPPDVGRALEATSALPRKLISKLGYDVKPMSRKELETEAGKLTKLQKDVAFNAGTELPHTGKTTNGYAYNDKTPGYYVGAVSGLPLFSSKEKFSSGTGWPSFWAPVDDDHVILRDDPKDILGPVRVEVLDAVSGAHLGHVFKDGPEPTGMRFCMNAAALTFVPSDEGIVPRGSMRHENFAGPMR